MNQPTEQQALGERLVPRAQSELALNDAELLRRVALRDDLALELLYQRYAGAVFAIALRVLDGRRAEAEEVVQETFLYAWRRGREYSTQRSTALGWLVMLARSRAIDRLRATATQGRALLALAPIGDRDPGNAIEADHLQTPLHSLEQQGARQIVERALGTLSESQRRMLELAFYEGLSHSEIATTTGISLGTVKTRIRRGLVRLSELLGDRGS